MYKSRNNWWHSVQSKSEPLRGMIQVRLLVCGCHEIDFLCCMLYAVCPPQPPKLLWNRLKENPGSYLPLLFLRWATSFLTKLNKTPPSKRWKRQFTSLVLSNMFLIPRTKTSVRYFFKICTTRCCLQVWIRFCVQDAFFQYIGKEDWEPSSAVVRSVVVS